MQSNCCIRWSRCGGRFFSSLDFQDRDHLCYELERQWRYLRDYILPRSIDADLQPPDYQTMHQIDRLFEQQGGWRTSGSRSLDVVARDPCTDSLQQILRYLNAIRDDPQGVRQELTQSPSDDHGWHAASSMVFEIAAEAKRVLDARRYFASTVLQFKASVVAATTRSLA